jgi:gamma-glutamyl hydrolase
MLTDLSRAFAPRIRVPLPRNDSPIIGIVSQPLDDSMVNDPRFDGTSSYIMTAYVKFMESAGARVVPLIVDKPAELEKLAVLDGVLLPGGEGDYLKFG